MSISTKPETDKPFKYAVSYLIYNSDRSAFVAVQRPASDADLPNKWGLPAGYHDHENRSWEESVRVSGVQKLGAKLEPVVNMSAGYKERAEYVLHMTQFEAKVLREDGTPMTTDEELNGAMVAPQPVEGVTQYQRWKWATAADLEEAAAAGSLCSQLFLNLAV